MVTDGKEIEWIKGQHTSQNAFKHGHMRGGPKISKDKPYHIEEKKQCPGYEKLVVSAFYQEGFYQIKPGY
jgi:hypothetical protein